LILIDLLKEASMVQQLKKRKKTKPSTRSKERKQADEAKPTSQVQAARTRAIGRLFSKEKAQKTRYASLIAIADNDGRSWNVASAEAWIGKVKNNDESTIRVSMKAVGGKPGLDRIARLAAALGHNQRLRIMLKLLEGSLHYSLLCKTTGLTAGPLYHHIKQLRLANLIVTPMRNVYELTRGGRNAILAIISVGGISRDRRRLPNVPPT